MEREAAQKIKKIKVVLVGGSPDIYDKATDIFIGEGVIEIVEKYTVTTYPLSTVVRVVTQYEDE